MKEDFNYISLEKVDAGLIITINKDGIEEIDDSYMELGGHIHYNAAYELFDGVRGNSEYKYFDDIGDAGFGLTSAPGITEGYYYDDNGYLTDKGNDNSKVYYYDKYMITSFVDELYHTGKVFFNEA